MEELDAIIQKFADSGWDLIAVPAQKWLDGNQDIEELVHAIELADMQCGNCGCELDSLYKRALELFQEPEEFDLMDNVIEEEQEDCQELKKCPFCGGTLQKGTIESEDASSLLNTNTFVKFYSEMENGKIFKKNITHLRLKAKAYYCENCWKFIGVYEQRS